MPSVKGLRTSLESTSALAATIEVSQLANKLSRGLSCGWAVFCLASSIRIHLHAEVWMFRPFKVNSLQYVDQLLSRRSSRRGLGSAENRSRSAASGMNNLCHIFAWGHCTPRTSPQHAQLLPSLTSSTHRALSSTSLSCPGLGREASHTTPGALSVCPTSTQGHPSAFSLSSLPYFCSLWSHPNHFAVRSVPCCWIWLKLAGGFKPYRGWLIDRQIDNMIARASFL